MKIKKEETSNIFLLDTPIENIFIYEYMTMAPGDYVKVYLLTQMYAGMEKEISKAELSKVLSMKEQTIDDALTYWQQMGLLEIHNRAGQEAIHFISQKELLYGQKTEDKTKDVPKTEKADILQDKSLEHLYSSIMRILNRPLGSTETSDILSWVEDYGANPEMIIYAYGYSVNSMNKDSVKYVGSIVKRWVELKLTTTEQIEEFLEENDRKKYLQRRIFKALGFTRNATEKEKEIMDRWLEQDGFTIDVILEACGKTSGISNPNLNYIDKVLRGKRQKEEEQKTNQNREPSHGEVLKYYDYIREKSEKEAENREKEIYEKFPGVKEADQRLRQCGIDLSREMLSRNAKKVEALREEYETLMLERAALLTENGYPADYLEHQYYCTDCKDTGLTDTGERCHCYLQRYQETKEWRNSLKK